MRIELKAVKVLKHASEETTCFEAKLYLDGVARGHVSNAGHGGENLYSDWRAKEALDAFGATLPPETHYGMELTKNADWLVEDALNVYEVTQQFRRGVRHKVYYLQEATGRILETRKLTPLQLAQRERETRARDHRTATGDLVLNWHPDGLSLFLTTMLKED